jgi:hypothetical protein
MPSASGATAPATPPQPVLPDRGRVRTIFLFIFAGCMTGSIGLGVRLRDRLQLSDRYGAERVRREHLHILPGKPPRASNGDALDRGFTRFDLVPPASLFLVGAGGTLLTLRARPRPCRQALHGRRTGNPVDEAQPPAARFAALLALLILFILNTGARWRWYAPYLSAATTAGALAACWSRYGRHP